MAGEKDIRNDSGVKKEKGKKNVVSIVVNVFIAIILVFVFTITINIIISSVSGKGYNSMFGMAMLAVETESMSTKSHYVPPEGKFAGFEVGDLIFVQEANDDMEFEVGDIITFYTEKDGKSVLLTHRIIHAARSTTHKWVFDTQGDTDINSKGEYIINTVPDRTNNTFLLFEDVVGKYTGTKWPGIGNVGLFLAEPIGYWLVIGVPALLILLYCIIAFVLAVTKRNKVESVDEKERIRAQILAELRAEQGLPPAAPTNGDGGVSANRDGGISQPAAPLQGSAITNVDVEASQPEEEAEADDDIPVVDEEDMEASISRIKEELAANYGDVEEPIEEAAPPEPKKPAAKKTTTSSTAKKTGTTAAKKTTGATAAKKTGSTTAKKTTSTSTAKKSTTGTTAKKTTTTKKSTTSKSGLIGTGDSKKTTKK